MPHGLTLKCFNDLVGRAYAAGADPALWPDFIAALDAHLDGVYLSLYGHDTRSNLSLGTLTTRYPEGKMAEYHAHYAQVNLFVPVLARAAPLDIRACDDWVPKANLLQSEFYNDFLRSQEDIGAGAGGPLFNDGERVVVLNGHVRFSDGLDKVSRLIETLRLLAPHVRRAFEMQRRLEGQRVATAGLETALDRVRNSVFLLDGRGIVVFANRAAQRALQAGEGLWQDRSGRLRLADRSAAAALGRALAGLAAGQGASFALRLAEARQVAATLDPLPAAGDPGALLAPPAPTRALLVLSDAPPEAPHAGAALARLYGLTPAEQALSLGIAAGKTLAEISDERGVSPQTLRNQLKSIFAKTGLSRQAQLAALVARQSL